MQNWQSLVVVDEEKTVRAAFEALRSPLELHLAPIFENVFGIVPNLWKTNLLEELSRIAALLSETCGLAWAYYWDTFIGDWSRLYERGRLIHRISSGSTDRFEVLAALGANESVAHHAAERVNELRHTDPPREHGSYPNGRLHAAASRGDAKVVQQLLQKGADVNERNAEGRTPLSYAASNARVDIARLLIDTGAEVDAHPAGSWDWDFCHEDFEGYGGRNALFHAAKSLANVKPRVQETLDSLNEIIDLLAACGCCLDTAAPYLAKAGRDDLLRQASRPALSSPDDLGNSALVTALLLGQADRVRFLLELGADPNAPNAFGKLPLMCIAETPEDLQLARLLIEAGADVNASVQPRRRWRRFFCGDTWTGR